MRKHIDSTGWENLNPALEQGVPKDPRGGRLSSEGTWSARSRPAKAALTGKCQAQVHAAGPADETSAQLTNLIWERWVLGGLNLGCVTC